MDNTGNRFDIGMGDPTEPECHNNVAGGGDTQHPVGNVGTDSD
jgi:hypothetical protein